VNSTDIQEVKVVLFKENLEKEKTASLGDESFDIPPPSLPVEQPGVILTSVFIHFQQLTKFLIKHVISQNLLNRIICCSVFY